MSWVWPTKCLSSRELWAAVQEGTETRRGQQPNTKLSWQKGGRMRLKKKSKERKEGSVIQGLEKFWTPPDSSRKRERKSEADYSSLL